MAVQWTASRTNCEVGLNTHAFSSLKMVINALGVSQKDLQLHQTNKPAIVRRVLWKEKSRRRRSLLQKTLVISICNSDFLIRPALIMCEIGNRKMQISRCAPRATLPVDSAESVEHVQQIVCRPNSNSCSSQTDEPRANSN